MFVMQKAHITVVLFIIYSWNQLDYDFSFLVNNAFFWLIVVPRGSYPQASEDPHYQSWASGSYSSGVQRCHSWISHSWGKGRYSYESDVAFCVIIPVQLGDLKVWGLSETMAACPESHLYELFSKCHFKFCCNTLDILSDLWWKIFCLLFLNISYWFLSF